MIKIWLHPIPFYIIDSSQEVFVLEGWSMVWKLALWGFNPSRCPSIAVPYGSTPLSLTFPPQMICLDLTLFQTQTFFLFN